LGLIRKTKDILIKGLNKIPFFEKPLPKNPFGTKPWANKNTYLDLYNKVLELDDSKVLKFEKDNGFSIDLPWINELALRTQVVIKTGPLNYFHGRLLYSELSKYIKNYHKENKESIFILETGTARGFSSICMSKALNDQNVQGLITTVDCISHNEKILWNCIIDSDGPCTRGELLEKWPNELKNILFLQGWTNSFLNKIGCGRINFAFLDAQHTKKDVLSEYHYIASRQLKGDVIVFDDVTPNEFDGVCAAVDYIKHKGDYNVKEFSFSSDRGYAIATKL